VTDPVLNDGAANYTLGTSERRSGTSTWYHAGFKNAESQTAANQTVAATKTFGAFGNPNTSSGTWKGPFGYGGPFGYQSDPDSGLMLLGHRYYDSSTGRFLTRDPIKDGRNWYGYCCNGPTGAEDSGGLHWRVIKGFLKHGLDQVISRDGGLGVSNTALLEAVKEGQVVTGLDSKGRHYIRYTGKDAVVILNKDGHVVTAHATSSRGLRQPRIVPRSGGSGSAIGAIGTVAIGADALMQGLGVIVPYRKRIEDHIRAIDDDNDEAYEWEGARRDW
jgi:RHS repeat-associated protein